MKFLIKNLTSSKTFYKLNKKFFYVSGKILISFCVYNKNKNKFLEHTLDYVNVENECRISR